MSNFAIPFSCVALLGAVVFYSGTLNRQTPAKKVAQPRPSAIYQQSDPARIWVMTDLDSNEYCLLYKTLTVEPGKVQLDIDPACDNVFSGSGYASLWLDHGNGMVSIADQTGNSIVKFSFHERHGLRSIENQSGSFVLVPSKES